MDGKSDGFKDFVLDQLADLSGITCRAMFGGYGLYRQEIFFGIVYKGHAVFQNDHYNASTVCRPENEAIPPACRANPQDLL
jgi:DNA transformation protein and related proteins